MRNLYKDSAYKTVVQMMKGKLKELKEKYKEPEPASLD
jgi:hypothetical protein